MINNGNPRKEAGFNEMRTLRWMCGVSKTDTIRIGHVRGSVKVAPVTKKITEKRLKWYGHVKRRAERHLLRRMLDAPVPGKRRRGRRENQVERLVEKRYGKCLKEEDVLERTKWKNYIHNKIVYAFTYVCIFVLHVRVLSMLGVCECVLAGVITQICVICCMADIVNHRLR